MAKSLALLQRHFSDIEAALAQELEILDLARQGRAHLMIWELQSWAVVLGYGRDEASDVDRQVCDAEGIAVVRRRSGGGTVLLGPGCLCYSLALPLQGDEHLRDIGSTNRWVLERVARALSRGNTQPVSVSGISDLTVGTRKIGGSAQRRTRDAVLWHGTLLYDFDLGRLQRCLREPDRQPQYREKRRHEDFVCNVPIGRNRLVELLTQAFDATQEPAIS